MNLREIQLEELKILKAVLKIIEQHNLRYYMLGGTFLGAVRHKGFIPWDDDIDIGLPREDYEKFIAYASNDIEEPLQLKTFFIDDNYKEYITRIINKNILFNRNDALQTKNTNLWIDIFPLDGMPENAFVRKFHQLRLLYRRLMLQYSNFKTGINIKKKRNFLELLLIKFGFFFTKFINLNTKTQLKKLDGVLKKYPYETSTYIVNFMGAYKFKEMFPRTLYEDSCEYQFEDLMLCAPKNYDAILRQMYGDYMTPPNVEQRFSHSLVLEEKKQ